MATQLFTMRRDDRGLTRANGVERNAWVRVLRGSFSGIAGQDQIDIDADSFGYEVGSQFATWTTSHGAFAIGAALAQGDADTHDQSLATHYQAEGEVRGSAMTVFGTWFANATGTEGLSIDAWVQRGRYENTVRGQGLAPEAYDSRAWTVSLEAGYAFAIHDHVGSKLYLEPQLQVIHTDYDQDTHAEANGTVVKPHTDGGLSTRLGLRLFGEVGNMQPFVQVGAIHDDTGNAIRFDDRVVSLQLDDVVYEGTAGVSGQFGTGWRAWGSLTTRHASGTRDNLGEVGVAYRW